MLSRSAERVYWAGRYLERAENTARLVQQYSQLLLDMPDAVGVEWPQIMTVLGARPAFEATGAADDEVAMLDFMLADESSGSSLGYSIRMARDCIRNSRDLLPQESWESANELHQFARSRLASTADGENRFEVLSECIGRCQLINGILAGTMSHQSPYHFLVLGQNLERADMTSRIIDVAAAYLQEYERVVLRYGSTLWTNVLKSVSGFQMYRQYCQPEVTGLAVINFMLNDRAFPRAARACLDASIRTTASLPRGDRLIDCLEEIVATLPAPLPADLDGAGVSALMDMLQRRLAVAHQTVVETWFLPGEH